MVAVAVRAVSAFAASGESENRSSREGEQASGVRHWARIAQRLAQQGHKRHSHETRRVGETLETNRFRRP